MSCQNNLKQLGLALHNYESVHRIFPPSTNTLGNAATQPWSGQSFMLPYLEASTTYDLINFSIGYHTAGNKNLFPPNGIAATRVSVLMCPSEPNDRERINTTTGLPEHYPLNYTLNVGRYLVFNPTNQNDGGGAFAPNGRIKAAAFIDGLTSTIAIAEVKAFNPRFHDAVLPVTEPLRPEDVSPSVSGGSWSEANGHTEWVCGRAIHTGFTTTFTPNTKVPHLSAGQTFDIDVSSSREGRNNTDITYAVITARSHHVGLVQATMMDGSVRSLTSSIDLNTYRSLGTRGGGEVVSDF
jgi:hypothetical protein